MGRTPLPLVVPDASVFARSLGRALKARHATGAPPPGHVELLNLLARALGQRNLQALKAAQVAAPPPHGLTALAAEAAPTALTATARKALTQFDERGRLQRWPTKYSVQTLVMWVLWTHFDGRRVYTESEVNAILRQANLFGDHVTLRRELINHRLMARKSDCSEYRKLAVRPDDEARALLNAWRQQCRQAPPLRPQAAARRSSAPRAPR